MSNIILWKQLIESEYDYFCIFEDDVIFDKQMRNLDSFIPNFPPDWDIVYLGVNTLGCKQDTTEEYEYSCPGDLTFRKMTDRCMPGAFGYIIRKKGALFLLINSLPISVPIDVFIGRHASSINIYVLDPPIVRTDHDFQSTIDFTMAADMKVAFGVTKVS